ncbi:MAG: tetratricopeptide repeat protein [Pyrinomonadaceae bacterium]
MRELVKSVRRGRRGESLKLKRTLVAVTLTFALIMSVPLQSVYSVIMTETELATLAAMDASAGKEADSKTESDTSHKRKGNSFVRGLTAPFKALGRLFGGKKKEGRLQRISEKDLRNFESTLADPVKANAAVKPSAEQKLSVNSEIRSSDYLVQGRELLNAGNLNEAIAQLSVAASNKPTSAEAHNLLGLAYAQKGLRDRALRSFENAVRRNDDEPEYLNNLGYVLLKQGEYETATKYLKRAAKLAPDNPRIWNNLGLALTERGKFDDAYKSFARALGEFKGHLNIATRLESLGHDEKAIKHLEKASTLEPKSTDVLTRLAALYESTGKQRQAQGVRSYLEALQTLAKMDSNR